MTSTYIGPNRATTTGGYSTHEEMLEANKQILKFAGPLKITHTKRADELMVRDFVLINGQPCRIESTTTFSPSGMLRVGVPEVKFVFLAQVRKGDFLVINQRPCSIADLSFSKCGCRSPGKVHVVEKDIFNGQKREALAGSRVLVSRLEFKCEHKLLLSISEDLFCSMIGDDNTAEENIEVPNEVLGKAIKDFWADGERNIMVSTTEIMEMKGVVFAREVVEMKLLGVQGAGMLQFENLETGVTTNIPHPMGEKGEEMRRLLEDVERGRIVMMEIFFPIPGVSSWWTMEAVSIGKEVTETSSIENELSSWTLIEK